MPPNAFAAVTLLLVLDGWIAPAQSASPPLQRAPDVLCRETAARRGFTWNAYEAYMIACHQEGLAYCARQAVKRGLEERERVGFVGDCMAGRTTLDPTP